MSDSTVNTMKRSKELKFKGVWILSGLILIVADIILSLAPASPPDSLALPDSDKALHFIVYAVMMFWFGQIYRGKTGYLVIAPCLILLGILLEFFQGMTGYRMLEYSDMTANAAGVLFGLFISRTRLGRFLYLCERAMQKRPRVIK